MRKPRLRLSLPPRRDSTRDFGAEAQKAAEAHLAACHEALFAEEEDDGTGELPESPASAPFCGCDTCVVREVLYGAWVIMDEWVEDALDGKPRPPELRLIR